MIITRKGSLIPRFSFSLTGHVMKAVVTLVPIISRTDDWISLSVNLLIWPLWTELKTVYFDDPKSEEVYYQYYRVSRGILIGKCS